MWLTLTQREPTAFTLPALMTLLLPDLWMLPRPFGASRLELVALKCQDAGALARSVLRTLVHPGSPTPPGRQLSFGALKQMARSLACESTANVDGHTRSCLFLVNANAQSVCRWGPVLPPGTAIYQRLVAHFQDPQTAAVGYAGPVRLAMTNGVENGKIAVVWSRDEQVVQLYLPSRATLLSIAMDDQRGAHALTTPIEFTIERSRLRPVE